MIPSHRVGTYIGRSAGAICQVADPSLTDYLTCTYVESGGRKCEKLEEHGDDGHWWSKHTIIHDRMGNGYYCAAFEEPVAVGAYRARLVERIADLSVKLEELDSASVKV